ncbi:MAG: hypothetical protein ABWY11_05710 [Umezawaea sp.]
MVDSDGAASPECGRETGGRARGTPVKHHGHGGPAEETDDALDAAVLGELDEVHGGDLGPVVDVPCRDGRER